ncbi:MAG: hypothetical protein P8M18_04890 [Woeseiaceae bacterium]|nr:hypothetical protein [Woeseiaceae bacterium]
MIRTKFILAISCLSILAAESRAELPEPILSPALSSLIRGQKFDVVLPQVMRDNDVDMWIQVMRGEDPLQFELGYHDGVYIFTDSGGDRVERAVYGAAGDREIYDSFGAKSEIGRYVAERNPDRIALNFADEDSRFNTISASDHAAIVEALGPRYAGRVVSARKLSADFLAGRSMAEIALYGRLLMTSTQAIESEFAKIVPGETTLNEIDGNVFVRDLDGNEENNTDYVVQPGDLIGILLDANAREFSEHNGGVGYVLKEGETELPPEIQRIWGHVLKTREIFRRNIEAGRTGAESLEILVDKLQAADYVYIDRDQFDPGADPEKTQVHIDFHAMGRIASQEEAPRISPTGWGRDLEIPLYHTFALEYMIHMPVPEWGERKYLYLCVHDGVMVTERGVEFPARPVQAIQIIR